MRIKKNKKHFNKGSLFFLFSLSLYNKLEMQGQNDPQMNGIYNVEQVLAGCCVLASFSVIQKYKWNHRNHCPLAVHAQIVIKVAGLGCEIIVKSKY